MRMFDITTVERLWDTCRQHIRILDTIAAGDATAAKDAMRLNIEGARAQVKQAIKEALARAYLAQGERERDFAQGMEVGTRWLGFSLPNSVSADHALVHFIQ